MEFFFARQENATVDVDLLRHFFCRVLRKPSLFFVGIEINMQLRMA
jgi:hypothetical protein